MGETSETGLYTTLIGAGVSLRLEAVQIIKLVQPTERTAASYGFTEEKGYDSRVPVSHRSKRRGSKSSPTR